MKKFLSNFIVYVFYLSIVIIGILFFYEKVIIISDDSFIDRKYFNLDEKDEIDLLIMGDSRAERQISPKIIDSILSINSLNLAISSGDIIRIKKFISNNQSYFNQLKKNVDFKILISVSDWQVNDNAQKWGILSHSTISLLSPIERLKYLNKKTDYIKFVVHGYKNFVHQKFRSLGLINLREQFDSNGFLGVEGILTKESVDLMNLDIHPWYIDYKIDGWRFKLYVDVLRFLNDNFNEVILLIPPTSEYWKIKTKNTNVQKVTKTYIDNLTKVILSENLKNIKIWDLYNYPPNEIDNSDFYDFEHLNVRGAKKLSSFISKKLDVN